MPEGWSLEAADFVNRCLLRKPERRLGFNGPDEVKSHCWFEDLDWEALSEKTLDAPFKPEQQGENFDKSKFIMEDLFHDEDPEKFQQTINSLSNPSI